MATVSAAEPAVSGVGVRKTFRRETGEVVVALDGIGIDVQHGALTALVGPDGAGKTTLIRLIAGLFPPDDGALKVLGIDVAAQPQRVQDRIAYMPQRFGLYEDLSVRENLDLYADLHGVSFAERAQRYPQLLNMTALAPFTARLAGRLSGGMKQKLGLACTLVRSPALLLLDEPTVGVDPLSRRELWQIILRLVRDEGLTVLMSTAYLDEAERCDQVFVLREGSVLASGRPADVTAIAQGRTFSVDPAGEPARNVQARLLSDPAVADAVPEAGQVHIVRAEQKDDATLHGLRLEPVAPRFEDGFMALLHHQSRQERNNPPAGAGATPSAPSAADGAATPSLPHGLGAAGPVIEVQDLVRKFGAFTAVDRIRFTVNRGEIFGLLGPNGAGKTTTFRMLCGLLSATAGTLRVAGLDLREARASARQHIGYVAQKFSLYGQLTVSENLDFFASAYGLHGPRKRDRIEWALRQFELLPLMNLPSGQLPGGYKQRLAMAIALLHEPEILFLDEPTSGADPMARREFWQRITVLAEQGVTIVVTTHFMEEAEYCDRVVILDAGRVLAQGTPAEIRRRAPHSQAGLATMEDAFIAIVEEARRQLHGSEAVQAEPPAGTASAGRPAVVAGSASMSGRRAEDTTGGASKRRRIAALVRKEARQLFRDPSSMAIGVVMPLLLILLFGFALSLDVTNVPVAVVLEDVSPAAAQLAAAFELSPYFAAQPLVSMRQGEKLLLAQQVDGIVRIRPDFARRMAQGNAEVQVLVYGTDANTARIIEAYAQGAVGQWLASRAAEGTTQHAALTPTVGSAVMQSRLWFNEANDSHYFLVPGLIVLIMTLIGSLLTALVMAREWERGTLEALFVTPVRAGEILVAKMIPYFVLGLLGLGLCILAARFLFHVPFRGSVLILVVVSMLYLLVALSIGLLISSASKSQFVSSMATLLVTFLPALFLSGFLFDLRSVPAVVRGLSYVLPARYYVAILQTVFLTGDVWAVIVPGAAALAAMAAVLIALARLTAIKRLV